MAQLQTTWGWWIAIYLFLGGLGAGAMVTAAVVALATRERFRSTIRFAAWASTIALAVGTACLLFDVGKPFRALVLFRSFVKLNSWMTIGAWLLLAAMLVNGLLALFWTEPVLAWLGKRWGPFQSRRQIWRTILAIIAIPLNLGVAIYTGMLLGALDFRPFWHTLLLPCLFTVSALDTGMGLVTAYATLRERAEGVKKLRLGLEIGVISLIALEGVALTLFLRAGLHGSLDASRSAALLVNGPLSVFFWALVVGVGLGIPLLTCIAQLSGLARRLPVLAPLLAITSCLIGGLVLRRVILAAGLPIMLSSPSFIQAFEGVRFLP